MTRRRYLLLPLVLATLVLVAPVGTAAAAGASVSVACRSSCVDLSVSVSDGVGALVPGGPVAYLVSVRNAGPSTVTSLVLTAGSPAGLRGVVFVPLAGSYSAGSGVWSGLSLAAGRNVSMLVAGTVDPAATGTFVESMSVAPPAGISESNPADNKASDTDTLAPLADLSVGVSDGTASVAAGGPLPYVVTVSNGGLSTVGSLFLAELVPASLRNVTFAPAVGSYNPTTHLWSGLSLPAGRSVTMVVSGTVDPAASGKLANTVSVTPPAGVIDPRSSNNNATDTDTVTARADLAVSVSDGATTAVPGGSTTYTIVITNTGPSTATGAAVADPLPAGIASAAWTATASAGSSVAAGSGSGAIATTATLLPGGSATYTLTAGVATTATGTVSDTATVTAPAGVSDPSPTNNTATDTDTLAPQAELAITNDDGAAAALPGNSTTYSIVVSNAGPSIATGASVTDVLPVAISSDSWTAVASAGSSVTAASGTGSIATTATLLPGGSATYTLVANVNSSATGTLADTAAVAAPAGETDPIPGNNSATDTDTLGTATVKFGDLRICGVPILPHVTSVSVREFLNLATQRLVGGPSEEPVADLDTIAAELNASFDGAPTTFALQHLSLSTGCQPVPWQTGDLTSYTQDDWATGVGTGSALVNNLGTVYGAEGGNFILGDPHTGPALVLTDYGAVRAYLPATGTPDGLTGQFDDPTSTSAGSFGGDLVALKLNVDFSDAGVAYFPRTCTPAGTTACPWSAGDLVTYAPGEWSSNAAARLLLLEFFETVYGGTGGNMIVGDYPASLVFLVFDSPDAVLHYLPGSGTPAALVQQLLDPTHSESGVFGADVLALKLNVDFSDADDLVSNAGLEFGDLTLCNLPTADSTYPTYSASLHALNGTTVRQFLGIVSVALSGEPSPYTPAQLDPLLQSLNASFDQGFITVMSPYLFNGPCA